MTTSSWATEDKEGLGGLVEAGRGERGAAGW